ncbi:Hypothetical protein GLP15_1838 [Giardia lamblia P15]|uniref:Uncharacterized protein n=1 Tax=Giardia intestinalis (strain P15) TaxID=658858 RepID=E1F2A9_GIAIA|nr:Hypothetical protein GLP15_1838 [Giardia lamblia P15]
MKSMHLLTTDPRDPGLIVCRVFKVHSPSSLEKDCYIFISKVEGPDGNLPHKQLKI